MAEYITKEQALETQCEKCPVYNCILPCSSYNAIKNLSPADVVTVIHAKWIYHKQNIFTGYNEYRECSNCNIWFEWEMPRNTYCPNCGAKMDGE